MDKSSLAVALVIWTLLADEISSQGGLRPFRRRDGSPCSSLTALSGMNCPCRLEGQKCKAAGTFCTHGLCQCGTAFLPIPVNGQVICFPTFLVTPSIQVPSTSLYGVTVPCNLPVTAAIPGFSLIFTNAVRPVICNPNMLFITHEDADNALDMDTTLGMSISYIEVDGNTGEIFPMATANYASGTGSYLTETYTGYCVDQRGITSNTFTFKVTFPNCPNLSGK